MQKIWSFWVLLSWRPHVDLASPSRHQIKAVTQTGVADIGLLCGRGQAKGHHSGNRQQRRPNHAHAQDRVPTQPGPKRAAVDFPRHLVRHVSAARKGSTPTRIAAARSGSRGRRKPSTSPSPIKSSAERATEKWRVRPFLYLRLCALRGAWTKASDLWWPPKSQR